MIKPELPLEVVDLIERGLIVQAIKELRASERISLGEAKERVDAYTGVNSKTPAGVGREPTQHELAIAQFLDHPSIYMGGPSRVSLRKAEKIMDYLQEEGLL